MHMTLPEPPKPSRFHTRHQAVSSGTRSRSSLFTSARAALASPASQSLSTEDFEGVYMGFKTRNVRLKCGRVCGFGILINQY